jgi:uncharacterized protein YpmS
MRMIVKIGVGREETLKAHSSIKPAKETSKSCQVLIAFRILGINQRFTATRIVFSRNETKNLIKINKNNRLCFILVTLVSSLAPQISSNLEK